LSEDQPHFDEKILLEGGVVGTDGTAWARSYSLSSRAAQTGIATLGGAPTSQAKTGPRSKRFAIHEADIVEHAAFWFV
jgi:hypothetical protein